ncbi:MAG: GTP cyclohydrolase II RibA [Proteobacteria bacterium]|nr:GTP cyclohydrolase II RibA [Pseudomonadota bacterium]
MPNEDVKIGTVDGDLARWFGDAGRLSVQRAVHELREGRPVRLVAGSEALVVAAADMLGGERIAEWATTPGMTPAGSIGLILPAPRLRHLGIIMPGPAHVNLADLTAFDIDDVLMAVKPNVPLLAHQAATRLEASALELVKRAYLLPAAVVLPATEDYGHMITVDASAVDTFHDRAARDVSIIQRTRVPLSEAEDAEFVVFRGGEGLRDQIAIVIGNPDPKKPALTRLHSACLTGDLFGSLKCDCGDQLRMAVNEITAQGGGVLLYLDQEGRGIGLLNKMRAYRLQEMGHDTVDADAVLGYGPDERRYGIAGAMLALLGFTQITLMTNNPEKISALEDFGVNVVGHQRLIGNVNPHNQDYLSTKAIRAGHLLGEIARLRK